MLLSSITMNDLYLWITSFMSFFQAPLFSVGPYTFSFYDVFIAGCICSLIGYGVYKIVFFTMDWR